VKVAIVCGAPSSEFLAPFNDPEWEIWVLGNRLNKFLDKGLRVTRVFEIHDVLIEHGNDNKYATWLVSKDLPMVVAEKFPFTNDNIKVFDYAASEALYGSLYLTSSPSYMVSQAISDGATHIGIYGVDLAIDDHEYFWQRPCMEAWIGFAKGRGIEITIPSVSHVGKSPYVEGRDWNGVKNEYKRGKPPFTQNEFKGMADKHASKIEEAQKQMRDLELVIHIHSGAQQSYEQLAKVARAVEAGVDVKSLSETTLLK
jgi:hypothetical protein